MDILSKSKAVETLSWSPSTDKALRRAAKRGAANLSREMVKEIDASWVMVGGVQVSIEGLRAFRL